MNKSSGRVLKADEVNIQGSFHLDLHHSSGAVSAPAAASPVTAPEPLARLVENTPDYGVIEVTCACGTKTRIRCEYANV